MFVLGINSAYHESAAALLQDGRLVCFVEEERFNRIKHAKKALVDNPDELPQQAIAWCLREAGITLDDVEAIGFSFDRGGRLENVGKDGRTVPAGWGTAWGEKLFHSKLMRVPDVLGRLGTRSLDGRFHFLPHHSCHAASAFLCSPFEEALILVVDGIGEFHTALLAHGTGTTIKPLFKWAYPHSIGFLWEKLSQFLGFSEYDACKVMGLSSYGDPTPFREPFSRLARWSGAHLFIDERIACFRSPSFEALSDLFGPPRPVGTPVTRRDEDLAATLQEFTEQSLLRMVREGLLQTATNNVCLAGGVALNCVTNARIQAAEGVEQLFIQPAANDAGTALGAALLAWIQVAGGERRFEMTHAFWGPEYTPEEMKAAIERAGLTAEAVQDAPARAARLIAEGCVVGWFQGRMEIGPRALGNRSLLADPRRPDMRAILNRKVKHREDFRPFAPSVLAEQVAEWFVTPHEPGFPEEVMLGTYAARPAMRERIPAVVHVDGTSLLQAVRADRHPLYHRLISCFHELTGVPMVLNTSFNDSEPIVMSPEHALHTFRKTGIDALFLGSWLVRKDPHHEPEVMSHG